jgi:hypothetical protein
MTAEAQFDRGSASNPTVLPPPRNRVPTLPFALEEYAQWSCLPDGDDDIVFEAGPDIELMTRRIPRIVALPTEDGTLTREETVLLSLVDGVSPVGILVQLVGTDPDDALLLVCDLFSRGLLSFE